MAAELEFYLFDSNEKSGSNQIYLNQCFDVNVQDKYQDVLDEIERIALCRGFRLQA